MFIVLSLNVYLLMLDAINECVSRMFSPGSAYVKSE